MFRKNYFHLLDSRVHPKGASFFEAASGNDKRDSERGVTLLELLIVMGVIATLAGAVIMIINPIAQVGKANDARRKSDLNQIQKSLEVYYQDNNAYPAHTIGSYQISGGAWGTAWTGYMAKVPGDQTAGRNYIYYSTGQTYFLYAYLQSPKDPQMCFPATGAACNSWSANRITKDCGGACNYGVSSSNTTP